jgi:hypothetical protein
MRSPARHALTSDRARSFWQRQKATYGGASGRCGPFDPSRLTLFASHRYHAPGETRPQGCLLAHLNRAAKRGRLERWRATLLAPLPVRVSRARHDSAPVVASHRPNSISVTLNPPQRAAGGLLAARQILIPSTSAPPHRVSRCPALTSQPRPASANPSPSPVLLLHRRPRSARRRCASMRASRARYVT